MMKEVKRVDLMSDIDKEIMNDCKIEYLSKEDLIAKYEEYLTEHEIERLRDGER